MFDDDMEEYLLGDLMDIEEEEDSGQHTYIVQSYVYHKGEQKNIKKLFTGTIYKEASTFFHSVRASLERPIELLEDGQLCMCKNTL